MNKRKAGSLLVAVALSAALVGCGEPKTDSLNSSGTISAAADQSDSLASTTSAEPAQSIEAGPAELSVQIFTTDDDFSKLTERTETFSFNTEQELVEAVLSALKQDGGENQQSLWKKIEWNSVQYEQENVTIDLHIPDSARLGAPGEAMLIQSLRNTLFQLDFIHSIELLVDGEKAGSLMGHIELEHPMIRS